jgi:pimeloyl-ACP methyl ester carboxylesterase
MAERMIETDGVELCTEALGEPHDPALLLIMGLGASMVWWEDDFCRVLASGGRLVIRYDHRDTGRSTSCEPGRPGYGVEALVHDAAAVLDAYEVPSAHVVGLSMGGALAQLLALEFPDRVASLVLISTSPAIRGERRLPPASPEYTRFLAEAEVDWADAASVIDHLVEHWGMLAGDRPFDPVATRELAVRDVGRARNFASAHNHDLLAEDDGTPPPPLSAIRAPTLVIHGSSDPLFALEHGRALADEIPDAELLTLDGAGHGLHREDWESVVPAILAHTATAAGRVADR